MKYINYTIRNCAIIKLIVRKTKKNCSYKENLIKVEIEKNKVNNIRARSDKSEQFPLPARVKNNRNKSNRFVSCCECI